MRKKYENYYIIINLIFGIFLLYLAYLLFFEVNNENKKIEQSKEIIICKNIIKNNDFFYCDIDDLEVYNEFTPKNRNMGL